MLSSDFKQQVTNILKNDYDIECHLFSPIPDYGDFRWSTLHCSQNGEKFSMLLRLTVDKGEHDGAVGGFKVILPEMYAHTIESINKKINLDLINFSVQEVCKEMSPYLRGCRFLFLHSNVDLIKGLYIKNGKHFDINKIESHIESDSHIILHTNFNTVFPCSDVKIINNEIMIKPDEKFKDNPAFKEPSTLADGRMDVFKANLMKSAIIYQQYGEFYEECYKLDVDIYLPLSYEELKKQLLVYQMANI